jgi:hypothetical protein
MLNSCSVQKDPAQGKVRETLAPVLQIWHEGPLEHYHLMPGTTEENICKQKTVNFDF